jgi:hypothetical protein
MLTATFAIALTLWTILRAPGILEAYRQFQHGQQMSFAEYIWISLYRGYLQAIWISSALILALGGLWREQWQGSSTFTLSLPLTRRRASLVRIVVAALATLILGFMPAMLIPMLSPLIEQQYPATQAIRFSFLMVCGGMILFAFGILLSHVIQKEFIAPAVGIAVVLIFFFITKLPQLDALDLFDLMSGKDYLTGRTFMLLGTLPWFLLCVSVTLAACVMLCVINARYSGTAPAPARAQILQTVTVVRESFSTGSRFMN